MIYCIILYYTMQCYAMLYYTILYYTILSGKPAYRTTTSRSVPRRPTFGIWPAGLYIYIYIYRERERERYMYTHIYTYICIVVVVVVVVVVVICSYSYRYNLTGRFVWLFRTDQSFLAWSLLLNQLPLMFVFNPLLLTVVTRCFVTFCKPGVSHRRATVLSTLTAMLGHFLLLLTWWTVIQVLGVYGYIILFLTFGTAVVLLQCLPDVMLSRRGGATPNIRAARAV